jgi:hypothetical protein
MGESAAWKWRARHTMLHCSRCGNNGTASYPNLGGKGANRRRQISPARGEDGSA